MTVEVTQAARDAAADLFLVEQGDPLSPHDRRIAAELRSGVLDDWDAPQAFARFERDLTTRSLLPGGELREAVARAIALVDLEDPTADLDMLTYPPGGKGIQIATMPRWQYWLPQAAAALAALTPRGDRAHELLRMLIAADDEAKPNGIQDCVDNDGHPYQSAHMAGLIMHARMLVQPFDLTAALAEHEAGQS